METKKKSQEHGNLGKYLDKTFKEAGLNKRILTVLNLARKAWEELSGGKWKDSSQVGSFRKGNLIILVNSSAGLQELEQFEKEKILDELRKKIPEIQTIKFRLSDLKPDA